MPKQLIMILFKNKDSTSIPVFSDFLLQIILGGNFYLPHNFIQNIKYKFDINLI